MLIRFTKNILFTNLKNFLLDHCEAKYSLWKSYHYFWRSLYFQMRDKESFDFHPIHQSSNYIKHRFIYKWVLKSFAFIQSTNPLVFLQMDIFQNEVLKKFWLTSDPPILYSFHKWIYFQTRVIEGFEFQPIHHSSHHFKNRCIFKLELKKPLRFTQPTNPLINF